MRTALDYAIAGSSTESATGGHTLNFGGGTEVGGPNATEIGVFPKALRLGGTVSASASVSDVSVTMRKFTVRVVAKPVGKVTGRQNLVESNRFPFAIYFDKGKSAATVTVVGAIKTAAHGWRRVDTRFRRLAVRTNQWVSIDLVYDGDTLGLFIDGRITDIQAFPSGTVKATSSGRLFVGSWVDGKSNRFKGDIAALRVIDGAPEELEKQIDEARSTAPWHISRKRIAVEKSVNLGAEASAVKLDSASTAYLQEFERGAIMYHDSIGAAFEMHGSIWAFYKGFKKKAELGFLVTDESNATKRGARKSLFSKGGIYWSSATGARPVVGQIYLDYENLGESKVLGLPTGVERSIPGGKEQAFQRARMYLKSGGAKAHEVHGEILRRFIVSGGVKKWGFPVTDEVDVVKGGSRANQAKKIGRSSEFEGATFYWTPRTGAREVHGHIRDKYLLLGGPTGELGFPTSDERDIPGVSGPGRINTFQKGSICWYGSRASIVVARPFKIFVGRVATREDEGFGMGQNDLYTRIKATDGSQTYDKRHPRKGDWGGRNSKDINFRIPRTFKPTSVNYKVDFRFKVVDADPGDDDHLGTFNKRLDATNGWGLRHNNGVYNSKFKKVKSLTWSVQPQVDISSLTEAQKWWGKDNDGTNRVNYQKYARAFSDVDSDAEWWDLTDWLEKAFHELVVEDIAKGGNCFGMSLEGIYARKLRSVFSMPLDRFKKWSTLESEFNIKHCYQVGAQPIWWFLGQFLTGNTHNPKDVFRETRSAFRRGEHPVVCIAQNYDFSGKPHCILPVAWDSSGNPWRMTVLDPNVVGSTRTLTVDPDRNRFSYRAGNNYSGGRWSGGRFHHMPYDLLDSSPRTPIWDALLLLMAGLIIIFASDTETASITDGNGRDLNAFGAEAKRRLKRGEPVDDFFFDYKGFSRAEALSGGMLFRRMPMRSSSDIRVNGALAAHQPIQSMRKASFRSAQPLVKALAASTPSVRSAISGRTAHAVLADTRVRPKMSRDLVSALTDLSQANREGTFIHKLRGKRNGKLEYAVKAPLVATKFAATTRRGEIAQVATRDLSTSKQRFDLKSPRQQLVDFTYESRLGSGKDRVQVDIQRMAAVANKPLEVNVRPGIGGVDVVTSGEPVQTNIAIKASIDGRLIRRKFDVPVQKGARFHLAEALDGRDLAVSRIDRVFGIPSASKLIRGS